MKDEVAEVGMVGNDFGCKSGVTLVKLSVSPPFVLTQ